MEEKRAGYPSSQSSHPVTPFRERYQVANFQVNRVLED